MTKYLLPAILIAMLLFTYSCKKDDVTTTPGNTDTTTTAKAQPVDTLLGTYMGNVRVTTDVFYGTSHIPEHDYDTTYRVDTIEIIKISADTFAIANGHWVVYGKNGHFKYNASNEYVTGNGGSGSSSGEWLNFFPGNDSLYLKLDFGHYSGYGPYSKTTNEFFGKK